MNKYESMTWEELRELPSEEFYKIPKKYLDQQSQNIMKEYLLKKVRYLLMILYYYLKNHMKIQKTYFMIFYHWMMEN